jgi:hypothetical protein
MSDEPGGWELERTLSLHRDDMREGFRAINERLDRLVSADVYHEAQRRIDDRLAELADDLSKERAARVEAIALERETRTIEQDKERRAREEGDAALQRTMDKMTATQRWIAASIVLPIALFAAALILGQGA